MQFIIDVTPGPHACEKDLTLLTESIQLTLGAAVHVINSDIFPEHRFNFRSVTELSTAQAHDNATARWNHREFESPNTTFDSILAEELSTSTLRVSDLAPEN